MSFTSRAWWLYICAIVPTGALYMIGPKLLHSGFMFNAIGASAILAILLGTKINRARPRLPWILFALGQGLFVSGDVVAYNWTRFFGGAVPFPSAADAIYLLVYPVLLAGLLILIRERNPARDRATLLDSLIVATGAGVLSWIFLIAPYAHDGSLSIGTKLTSIAYPVMDLLLLGVVVHLAMGAGRRGAAFWLLLGGGGALLVTDSIFGWMLLHGGYSPPNPLDCGWIVFYALWAGAALHPSMGALAEPAAEPVSSLTRARLALLAVATLIAPTMLIVRLSQGDASDAVLIGAASIVLFSLVVARMAGLVRHNQETLRRESALREAGFALVSATSRDELHTASLDAARSLAGEVSVRCLYVAGDTSGAFDLVASAGTGPASPPAQLALADLPEDAVARLRERRGSALDARALAAPGLCSGAECSGRTGWLVPLFIRTQLRGALLVVADAPLGRPTTDALDGLATAIALALESATLTEDLLRRESEARYRALFQHSSDVVSVIRPDTTIMYVSPSVERLLDYATDALEGSRFTDLVHADDRGKVSAFLAAVEAEPAQASSLVECRVLRRDGAWLHVETVATNLLGNPNVGGIVLTSRDVSERKAFEERLTHQAFHDTLTGLPNRGLFHNRVEHALERQRRGEPGVAVMFMDVDDFKAVNDSLGHGAGDALLGEIGARLRTSVRGADTAARLSGDEFAVLVEGVKDESDLAQAADRLSAIMSAPYALEGREILAPVSMGIAVGDADGRGATAAEELLRKADAAMYGAKELGKGRYQVFDPQMQAAALARLALKDDLQRAVSAREFIVHYQPIVELETGVVSAVEALVRWQHPERGMVAPGEFIPVAEDTGLIVDIGRLVLDEACREAVRLQQLWPHDPPLVLSVNLSGRQLQRSDICADIVAALDASGLDPHCLLLEITESTLMTDVDLAIMRLEELRALGVRLAIDDFGTGYSSLNYIRQFPFDVLKVDKSFIDDLAAGGEVSALTAAIIDLARILDLSAVAEGIETSDQLERLIELKCKYGQGYFLHRPLTTPQIENLIGRQVAQPVGVSSSSERR